MNNSALRRAALALTLCSALSLAATAQPLPCPTTPADSAAVTGTLRAMYAAASASDLAQFHALLAPGFYAYDGGVRYDGDAIMKLIMQYQAKDAVFVWNVTQPEVHISCNMAWIAYVNSGSIKMSPTSPTVPTTWLESAVLKREAATWKLVFFHSTRVPPPTPPAK